MKHSESIANIAAALSAFQAAHIGAAKNAQNPHLKNKYADLASIWEAIRAPLTENGLAVVQGPAESEAGKLRLVTKLLHKSGEWMESTIDMPLAKQDPQGYGSALTYARRYALAAMLGVIQEDDDAAAAMPKPGGGSLGAARGDYRIEQMLHNAEPVPKPAAKPAALANPAQIKALWATAKEACGSEAEVEVRMYIEQLGLTSSKEMTAIQASEAIDTFKRIAEKKAANAG